jgi:peptide-methionine (S)-S-oxide reductase
VRRVKPPSSVRALSFVTALLLAACKSASAPAPDDGRFAELPKVPEGYEVATLAGGCFWCVEADLEKVRGVLLVTSGYTGGHVPRPTYEQTNTKTTGHTEAVQVIFDPKRISYAELLEVFWRSIDPTDDQGQFCDRGNVYRPEIFVHDAEQRKIAEASKQKLHETKPFAEPIKVPITDASTFWPAERYHQDFYKTNPDHYRRYRQGCGRDRRLEQLWGTR